MSVVDRDESDESVPVERFPEFELSVLFDDIESPSEVTVFSDEGDLSTAWITVDEGTAVPLEEVR